VSEAQEIVNDALKSSVNWLWWRATPGTCSSHAPSGRH